MRTHKLYSLILLFTFMLSIAGCKNDNYEGCDYKNVVKSFLKGVKDRDQRKLSRMLAFESDIINDKLSNICKVENNTAEIIPNVDSINYVIKVSESKKFDYAVVRAVLHEDLSEIYYLEVRFMAPDSPYPCKIESFDIAKVSKSFELKPLKVEQ